LKGKPYLGLYTGKEQKVKKEQEVITTLKKQKQEYVAKESSMSTICISPEFLESFMDLPKQIQRKTIQFIEKFSNNPQSPGINYEKINTIGDTQLRSGRIDREYRAIIKVH
jgi:mRNA-degrading endonuclease RelE of RelBE toxin-antitoxin system